MHWATTTIRVLTFIAAVGFIGAGWLAGEPDDRLPRLTMGVLLLVYCDVQGHK